VTTAPPVRLLVIDESLDKRLAQQLEGRVRRAKSADWLGMCGMKDEVLLRALAKLPEVEPVLVTGDDDMPGEHRDIVAQLKVTIATVDGRPGPGWGREEWKKEIVHRWAHSMQLQTAGTIRRYSVAQHHPWRRRRGRSKP
jgi:hypothetical protein